MLSTHGCRMTQSTCANYMLKSAVPWYYLMSDTLLPYFLELPCVPVWGKKLKIWFKEHIHNREYNFLFCWRYNPLWALACRTIPLHLSLSITNSLHLLAPNTWRSLCNSSLHLFLGLPLSSRPFQLSEDVFFLGILSSSIPSRWPGWIKICHSFWTIIMPLV